jgi:uncharacterized protein (TIGR00252 family)
VSNFVAGHNAEKRAAHHLQSLGFDIIQLNWKTRYCEIDIVAKKNNVVYFVEVKYRRTTKYGSGLDYITPKKLRRMHFAAEVWVQEYTWTHDYRLAALAVDATQIEFIDSLTL